MTENHKNTKPKTKKPETTKQKAIQNRKQQNKRQITRIKRNLKLQSQKTPISTIKVKRDKKLYSTFDLLP